MSWQSYALRSVKGCGENTHAKQIQLRTPGLQKDIINITKLVAVQKGVVVRGYCEHVHTIAEECSGRAPSIAAMSIS